MPIVRQSDRLGVLSGSAKPSTIPGTRCAVVDGGGENMTTAEAIKIMEKRNTPEDRFVLFALKRKAEADKAKGSN